MSVPEPSHLFWREQAKIDYFSLFVPIWLSLNAWMRDRFTARDERGFLELLKLGNHPLSEGFTGLVQSDGVQGSSFRANLGELHRALVSANLSYATKYKGRTVSLASCAIDWNQAQVESILREGAAETEATDDLDLAELEDYQNLHLGGELWVENDPARLFAAYIEIVYQVRCGLFHGALPPNANSERVVRYAYLTLFAVMETV